MYVYEYNNVIHDQTYIRNSSNMFTLYKYINKSITNIFNTYRYIYNLNKLYSLYVYNNHILLIYVLYNSVNIYI